MMDFLSVAAVLLGFGFGWSYVAVNATFSKVVKNKKTSTNNGIAQTVLELSGLVLYALSSAVFIIGPTLIVKMDAWKHQYIPFFLVATAIRLVLEFKKK